jgi:hypothetical protein
MRGESDDPQSRKQLHIATLWPLEGRWPLAQLPRDGKLYTIESTGLQDGHPVTFEAPGAGT